MTNQHSGSMTAKIIELASRAGGVGSDEVAEHFKRPVSWASAFIGRLVTTKGVISAKLGHRTCRYFTRQEDADRWLGVAPKPGPSKRSWRGPYVPVQILPSTPPALLPGEPIIPKGVKIQRGPDFTPRYQSVALLTDKPQPVRASGEQFKQYKSRGF